MNLQSHIDSLRSRHQALDVQLGEEDRRPHPDADRLIQLKHQKLRLKDELERLASQP